MVENITKIGMIGGGIQSFMGAVHRAAIVKTGNIKLVTGAFGASYRSSYECREEYGIATELIHPTYREVFRQQAKLSKEERVAFVATVLPNTMHYPVAMNAMDSGMAILGEKPFTINLDEAKNLVRKQRATGVPYRIAMVYPAYSMLVKARKLLRDGVIGSIRKFMFSMQTGWMAAHIENQGCRRALWRTDAHRNGSGGVITDSAPHCQFVLEWLTGVEIAEVCCSARACVPGRLIPDDATVLVHTREGLTGTFFLSQVAVGHNEGLSFEITGDKGAMYWRQDRPGELRIVGADGKEKLLKDATAEAKPIPLREGVGGPFGADEAYVEALARVYREFAEEVSGKPRKKSRAKDDRILGMTIEEGLRSVAVTDAIQRSILPDTPEKKAITNWVGVAPVTLEFPRTLYRD